MKAAKVRRRGTCVPSEPRRCAECAESKPRTSEFWYKGADHDGLRGPCKLCYANRAKTAYWEDVDKSRTYQRAFSTTDEYRIHQRRYMATVRLNQTPLDRITSAARSRVRQAIKAKGLKKLGSTCEYLGCSFGDLQAHLASQFIKGMTLENHGEWHIDHRIPIKAAQNEAELREILHYTNLQPLWATDNLTKGSKLPQ